MLSSYSTLCNRIHVATCLFSVDCNAHHLENSLKEHACLTGEPSDSHHQYTDFKRCRKLASLNINGPHSHLDEIKPLIRILGVNILALDETRLDSNCYEELTSRSWRVFFCYLPMSKPFLVLVWYIPSNCSVSSSNLGMFSYIWIAKEKKPSINYDVKAEKAHQAIDEDTIYLNCWYRFSLG